MRGGTLLLQSSNFGTISFSKEQTIKLFIGVLTHVSPALAASHLFHDSFARGLMHVSLCLSAPD